MKFGLPEQTYQALQAYFRQQKEVEKVIIYGSRAMGTHRRASDIDLAFLADQGHDPTARLLTELDELPTPYKFDLTNLRTLTHDSLRDHIERVGKVFYERELSPVEESDS